MGHRFRLHDRRLPGTPDIVLRRHRKIVFVHGCFWHGHEGCRRSALPETRHDWWAAKIAGNRQRDDLDVTHLQKLGWDVLVVWECETRHKDVLAERLRSFMQSGTTGA
jgi:DNA mismatch endonuclease (patch repair protein)